MSEANGPSGRERAATSTRHESALADDFFRYDPDLADFAAAAAANAGQGLGDPVAGRANAEAYLSMLGPTVDTSGLEVEDRTIPGPEGAPEVPVRVYRPAAPASTVVPGLIYIHGGGFYAGSLDTEHGAAAVIARELGIVVVSVDYRLAPEDPFPAGVEDSYAALVWLHANAADLGVDPPRIGAMGGSAGGGIAAGVTLLARDRGGPTLCFQYLGIPELDDRLDTWSMRHFTATPMWSRPSALTSWAWYLGTDEDPASRADVSPYASPARATDVAGLPPTYISVMEYDPLRDEGIAYAIKLLQAGVTVELHLFPGTFHGSSMIPAAAITKREHGERIAVLRRGLRVDA
jgi:acetyl esterase/lipase